MKSDKLILRKKLIPLQYLQGIPQCAGQHKYKHLESYSVRPLYNCKPANETTLLVVLYQEAGKNGV
eukprot:snap_masked-scaffold_4-processed-gene-19.38-mRNA-1 protein AED:1.00 eAED:1.00 QI:0/0/0/0/1/1/2/0/65